MPTPMSLIRRARRNGRGSLAFTMVELLVVLVVLAVVAGIAFAAMQGTQTQQNEESVRATLVRIDEQARAMAAQAGVDDPARFVDDAVRSFREQIRQEAGLPDTYDFTTDPNNVAAEYGAAEADAQRGLAAYGRYGLCGMLQVDRTGESAGTITIDETSPCTVSGVPVSGTAPSAPTGLATQAGDGQVSLTWNAASDPDNDLVGYNVYVAPDGATQPTEPTTSVASNETWASVGDLTNGTTYDFWVTAYDAEGSESAADGPVDGTPDEQSAPPPPDNPQGLFDSSTDEITITWDPVTVSASASPLEFYRIYRCSGNSCAPTQMVGSTAAGDQDYVDDDIVLTETYTYAVTAVNEAGMESVKSRTVTVFPGDSNPPAPPSNLTVTIINENNGDPEPTDAELVWDPNQEVDLYGYRIYRCNGQSDCTPSTFLADVGSSTVRYVDLDRPDGYWTYHVVAVDTNSNVSDPSNLDHGHVTVWPPDPVGSATSAPVAADNPTWKDNDVELTWTLPADPDRDVIRIYRCDSSLTCDPTNFIDEIPGTATSYTNFDRPDDDYTYGITTVDRFGNEGDPVTTAVTVDSPPDPINPTATVEQQHTADFLKPNDVALSWAASTYADAQGYLLYRCAGTPATCSPQADGTLVAMLPASTTSYDDTNRPDGDWVYSLVVVDAGGNQSPESPSPAAVTTPVPVDVADNFNRTNGTPLNLPTSNNAVWQQLRAGWVTSGSHAYTNGSTSTNPVAVMDQWTPDVTINSEVGPGDAIYLRVSDANNWIRVRYRQTDPYNHTHSYNHVHYHTHSWSHQHSTFHDHYNGYHGEGNQPGHDHYASSSHRPHHDYQCHQPDGSDLHACSGVSGDHLHNVYTHSHYNYRWYHHNHNRWYHYYTDSGGHTGSGEPECGVTSTSSSPGSGCGGHYSPYYGHHDHDHGYYWTHYHKYEYDHIWHRNGTTHHTHYWYHTHYYNETHNHTHYYNRPHERHYLYLEKSVGGTVSVLDTDYCINHADLSGCGPDDITVTADGSLLTVSDNTGRFSLSVSDSFNSTVTAHGIGKGPSDVANRDTDNYQSNAIP